MSRELIDSGIEWIGKYPSNWRVLPLKGIVNNVNEKNNPIRFTNILSLTNTKGVIPYEEKGNQGNISKEDLTQYKIAYKNTVIINSMNLKIGSVGYSNYDGCVSPVYYVLSNKENSNIKFINYLFQSNFQKYLSKYGKGIMEIREKISMYDVLHSYVPVPNVQEQEKIVNFLDNYCTKIEKIIDDNNKEIDLLNDYKKTIITESVSKGIQRSQKDNNTNTWKYVKITRLIDPNDDYPIGDGDHGLVGPNDYVEEGIPYIRVQNIGWATDLLLDNIVYITEDTNNKIKSSTLKPNDVLVVKTGATIGKVGILPSNMNIANTTSHVGKITVSKNHNPRFLYYFLSSDYGYRQLWEYASMKTTRPELSNEELKSIKVIIPPSKDEEDKIVEYLDNVCLKIDEVINYRKQIIEKLDEYKRTIIYEYVTGKKEVN